MRLQTNFLILYPVLRLWCHLRFKGMAGYRICTTILFHTGISQPAIPVQRSKIVSGKYEPNDEECEYESEDDEDDEVSMLFIPE